MRTPMRRRFADLQGGWIGTAVQIPVLRLGTVEDEKDRSLLGMTTRRHDSAMH
jgi:hypothetical protein